MSDNAFDLDNILNEIISKNVGEDLKEKVDELEKKNDFIDGGTEKAEEKEETPAEEIKDEAAETPAGTEPEAEEEPAEEIPEEETSPEIPEEDFSDKPVIHEETVLPFFDEEEKAGEEKNDSESVDLFELGGYESENKKKKKNKKKWHKTKKGKIFISVISILLVMIIATGGYGVYYFNDFLNNATTNTDDERGETPTIDEWDGMDNFSESFDNIDEASKGSISSYRNMVRKWYYNGEPARSSNVINVMLIGEDTRGSEISEEGTRADSAIIASVNTNTGEIVLTSVLRDSYVYYETTPGDESTGRYSKINEAMSLGGLNCYINAVERIFKINIDNYVIVNFTSFQNIIDAVGGVTITMTNAEIREINNHPKTYGNVSINGEAGDLLLNGKQALAYCRIRHIDSDNVRADRQKTVLLQLFKKVKDSGTLKLAEIVSKLLPYVKTGYSKSEILKIGQYAISHGWLAYKTVTYTVPTNETDTNGNAITTCKGGEYYGYWVWKIDCPLAAQILQKKIYGKTNITLAENRPDFLSLSDY